MLDTIFEQITEKISYGTDIGVSIEIKDFFRGCEDVDDFTLEVLEGKRYKISVKLKTYGIQEVTDVFLNFLHFIEYSAATFYTRKVNIDYIEYLLFSVNDDNHGFYCQVLFLNK